MSLEDFISDSNSNRRPRKLVLYGTHGIGKSTFAAGCPLGPVVFLPTEDGYQDLNPPVKAFTVSKKRIIDTEADLFKAIDVLLQANHDFKTVVLDSAEAAETIFQREVARLAKKDSIADIGFGKGYAASASKFETILAGFDALNAKGMMIIIIAHADIERFNDPALEPYDRYTLRLDKRVNPGLQEWADEVLFANYKVYTKSLDEGFGKKSIKAVGSGDRVLYTTEKPTHDAKNRLGFPDEMEMDWKLYGSKI